MTKEPKLMCQATVEDFENGQHFTMQRFTIPKARGCKRAAKGKLGKLCLCTLHLKLAQDGLVDDGGTVAARQAIRDVRKYPQVRRWDLQLGARSDARTSTGDGTLPYRGPLSPGKRST